MNSLVAHLLRKDIRHLRVMLVVWTLLVLSQAFLIGSGIGAAADDMVTQMTFQIVSYILPVLKALAIMVMIPLLIQDEPLVGTTAFWFTRPLSRKTVMAAKLLFIAVILILFPLAVEIVVFAGNGVQASHIALAVPEILLKEIGFIVQIMMLAVLTHNFARFAILGVIAFIVIMLVGVVAYIGKMYFGNFEMLINPDMSLTMSRVVISNVVIILTGLAVIANQYVTRTTKRSVVMALSGLVLMFVVSNSWPVDFFNKDRAEPDLSVVDCSAIALELDEKSTYHHDEYQMRKTDSPRKKVTAKMDTTGLSPEYFTKVDEVVSRLEMPDGKTFSSTNVNTSYTRGWNKDSLQELFQGYEILNSGFSYNSVNILSITSDEFFQYGRIEGTLSLDVDLAIYSYALATEIPLEKNARFSKGSEHVVVSRIMQQPSGCTVILRRSDVNLLFAGGRKGKGRRGPMMDREPVLYALRNLERREIYLPKDDNNFSMIMQQGQRLTVMPLRLLFEPQEHTDIRMIVDEDWLKGADLVRVEVVQHGNCRRALTKNEFQMDNERRRSRAPQDRRDGPDLDVLAGIVLPENPTREDVEKYVRDIVTDSEKQSRKSSRDPQVDMLMAVGPEHVDILLKQDENYYVNQVVDKLAGPEHKDLVLKELSRNTQLAGIVIKQGWVEEARDTLIAGLKKRPGYLPQEWIRAVASFEDPATYSDLKQFLIGGSSKHETFKAIRNLPGMELSEAVDTVWRRSRLASDHERRTAAYVAVHYGHMDALDYAVNEMERSDSRYWSNQFKLALESLLPADVERKNLAEWLRANRANMVYDREAGMYKVDEGEN